MVVAFNTLRSLDVTIQCARGDFSAKVEKRYKQGYMMVGHISDHAEKTGHLEYEVIEKQKMTVEKR